MGLGFLGVVELPFGDPPGVPSLKLIGHQGVQMFTGEEQANETVDFDVTWRSGRRRLSMHDLNGHLLLCSGSIIIPPGCEHKHIMPTGITRT
jgi:hypothetical protein